MFTGIIEETGALRQIRRQGRGLELTLDARTVLENTAIGDSIAVNGVCLTVTKLLPQGFTADVMAETVSKTALSRLRARSSVHLERALRADSRLGGHFVTGHIDGVGAVISNRREGTSQRLAVRIPTGLSQWIVPQGSIALDGVSLTVQNIRGTTIEVALIPETLRATLLGHKRPGEPIHIETDMLIKQAQLALKGRAGARR